jgi:anti-anti-sigma regulatory factor
VFSFFSRRAKTQPDNGGKQRPAATPTTRPVAAASAPSVDQQRAAARRTAEQIDRIESEMIVPPRDDVAAPARPARAASGSGGGAALAVAPRAATAAAADAAATRAKAAVSPASMVSPAPLPRKAVPPAMAVASAAKIAPSAPKTAVPAPVGLEPERRPAPALEALVFTLPAESAPPASGEGIDIAESALPPELEEAAILFANGQSAQAAATLEAAIERDDASRRAWLMLLDVLHAAGRRADFDARSIAYAARFETSPPGWRGIAGPVEAPRRVLSTVLVSFGDRIDAETDRAIEQARKAAQQKRSMILDFSSVGIVDTEAALPLVRLLELLIQTRREVTVRGARRLADAARATIEPGRRDPATGGWQLALVALRLLGEQAAFEDLSIDYCVTYEVSPPSWEPVPPQLSLAMGSETIAAAAEGRVEASASTATVVAPSLPQASRAPASLSLRGELAGMIGAELGELRAFAADRREVLIDARELQRLDFVAAGELLNELVALGGLGKTVVIEEPSHVVEALLIVMGIRDIARVRRRG